MKYHRKLKGMSTREVAEKVGIVTATLVLYENDKNPIKYETAVALDDELGIDCDRLLTTTLFLDYPCTELLKKVRNDLSLTQVQIAEEIGISQTAYSGWKRGVRSPIVERFENGTVYTVEGNSGDACRQRDYAIGSPVIYGYGTPAY